MPCRAFFILLPRLCYLLMPCHIFSPLAVILTNVYREASSLIDGECLLSEEGTTPIAMVMYAFSTATVAKFGGIAS